MNDLIEELQELETAEEFLDYFGIDYEPRVVQVNRLHILQRFHDYLKVVELPADEEASRTLHAQLLARAYGDFVHSTPQREQVFSVFRKASGTAFVGIERIGRGEGARG